MPAPPPKLNRPPAPPGFPDRLRAYDLVIHENYKMQVQILEALEWIMTREREREERDGAMRAPQDSIHEWDEKQDVLDRVLKEKVKDPNSRFDSVRAQALIDEAIKQASQAWWLTPRMRRALLATATTVLLIASHLVRTWLGR